MLNLTIEGEASSEMSPTNQSGFFISQVFYPTIAATKLGISGWRVRYLLAEGRQKGRKLGGTWVVLDLNYARKGKTKRRQNK